MNMTMTVIPTRKTFHTGTIELSYLEWGTAYSSAQSKPQSEPSLGHPVLLLHGLADHAGVWHSLAHALAPHHPVVAIEGI